MLIETEIREREYLLAWHRRLVLHANTTMGGYCQQCGVIGISAVSVHKPLHDTGV
ncbi:hypothetical protein GCM10011297_34400 [Bacterioplanes sanyensis]|nr:hypothetical protein GCM10011297_34400 [Bacterioplanes sanyensis]